MYITRIKIQNKMELFPRRKVSLYSAKTKTDSHIKSYNFVPIIFFLQV